MAPDDEVTPSVEELRAARRERNGGFHDLGYVIDCDYGSAWGWHFHPDRKAFEGGCMAMGSGWSGDAPISQALLDAFDRWQLRFEQAPIREIERGQEGWGDFSWRSFHAHGLCLAKRLKRELGPEYTLLYCRPWEDESGRGPRVSLILDSCTVAPYRHVPMAVLREAPPGLN